VATIVSYDEVIGGRKERVREDGKMSARIDFIVPPAEQPEHPQAFISEQGPGRLLRTHFHETDQFQIFISGGGTNGKHAIAPYQIHFARKHTPYGPIAAAADRGCAFFTLRPRRDAGAQYLPEQRSKLDAVPSRKPWQVSADVRFPQASGAAAVQPVDGVADDRGLSAHTITVAPNGRVKAPAVDGSDGQYIVMLEGSMIHEGQERASKTVIFVEPGESAFDLVAGKDGLQAVVLNFPRNELPVTATSADMAGVDADGEFKIYSCVLCGFIYDEAEGMPSEGIPAGTRWKDVPDDWGCPDCAAKKADFEMVEI
jgi:rubredoxin